MVIAGITTMVCITIPGDTVPGDITILGIPVGGVGLTEVIMDTTIMVTDIMATIGVDIIMAARMADTIPATVVS